MRESGLHRKRDGKRVLHRRWFWLTVGVRGRVRRDRARARRSRARALVAAIAPHLDGALDATAGQARNGAAADAERALLVVTCRGSRGSAAWLAAWRAR